MEKSIVQRGSQLANKGYLKSINQFGASLQILSSSKKPLIQNQRVRVHLGTQEVMARIALTNNKNLNPGESGAALLRLERKLVAAMGDKFIIRSYSPIITIGGGEVLEVLIDQKWKDIKNKVALLFDQPVISQIISIIESQKAEPLTSNEIKYNPNASMCFHWKSLLRQVRITGKLSNVSDEDANNYYNSRSYGSRIGAWASNQSSVLKSRDELLKSIEEFKKKYTNEKNIPRPKHWSGWNLNPIEIEFWLDGKDRIHERLRYTRKDDDKWEKDLLSP